ncbi:MAG TPA: hypothetical protein VM029_20340 [Opitutaceae bacterium]|nr:hypothetical protein [Opitutaceae bacterium]
MKALSVLAWLALAIAGGVFAFRQQQASEETRHLLVGLQAQLHRLERNPAAEGSSASVLSAPTATPLSADTKLLAQLRDELAALRTSTQEIAKVAQATAAAQNPTAGIPNNLVPSSAWKNAGKATPEKAVETVLWAAVGGDVDTLAQALTFTPTARAKADAWFASLSENTRRQYGTPEKLVALMVAKDAETLSSMQLLGSKEVSPDNVGVRIRFATETGKTKDDNFLMHRSTDGWRLILPDAAVEKFAQKVSGGK